MQFKTRVVVTEHIDSSGSNSSPALAQAQNLPTKSNSIPFRRGKWTHEEEAYALAAIRGFKSGYLDCAPGSRLRTYLSEKLQCDPMRITKRFTGNASIGKKVFHPAVRDDPKILKKIEESQSKLQHLYLKWIRRLESQEQEMARKSMAAVAVSVASSYCDNTGLSLFSTTPSSSHLLRELSWVRVPTIMPTTVNTNKVNIESDKSKSNITKTAAWLEQAEKLVSSKTESDLSQKDIKQEMKDILHLITKAPEILAISAGLPHNP